MIRILLLVVLFSVAPSVLADGADASNPTSTVNFQDIRYRYFSLANNAESHSVETEGAYTITPNFKVTNELHVLRTNRSGKWETDPELLKVKGIGLVDIKPFEINAKFAVGLEWLKDLGDSSKGTGLGADQIAPLTGIGWVFNERDFLITLIQYFHSYREDPGVEKIRATGPRVIYIRKIPQMKGWLKADWKGLINHENANEFTSLLEIQLGTMLSKKMGTYAELHLGDKVLNTNFYEWGVGVGMRYMY